MFNIILISFFITRYVYASNKSIDDIKAISGGIAFNPGGNTIYFKQNAAISDDFSNINDVQTYKIQSKDIIDIIKNGGFLSHGKLNNEDSVYINQITGKQEEGAGISIDKPTVFYGGDLNGNGYKADTLLTFSKGLMAFDMSFTAADKNVFIVEQGFTSLNDKILPVFGIFNITAKADANAANFIIADNNDGNGIAISIQNQHLLSEKNLLRNAFISNNGDIVLQDEYSIMADNSLISDNDKFIESYAKTTDTGGNITVNKEKIIINDVSTGQAFFNAANGDIIINSNATDYSPFLDKSGSITISTTDGTKKIAGFAMTNKNINLTTGNMTVDVTAIGDKANMFSAGENITATIDKLTFKTYNDSTAKLAKSVFEGKDVKVTLDSLTFDGKANFGADVYLIEATGGNAKLTINDYIDTAYFNSTYQKLFSGNETTRELIVSLKGDGSDFNVISSNKLTNLTINLDNSKNEFKALNGILVVDNADANLTLNFKDLTNPATFGDDIVKTINNGKAILNINFNNVKNNVNFSGFDFLVNSKGGAELKIIGNDFNWEVANRIGEKLVKADNDTAKIAIDQLDLSGMGGSSVQFNGFNFLDNVKGDIDLTINKIYKDENTKIVGLVSRDNGYDLNVKVNSDIELNWSNTSIGYLALSKNNGSATFNLGSNDKSIKLSGGTTINGFLVGSTGGNANLLNMTGGLYIDGAKFKDDNSFLVEVKNTGTTAILGNTKADITIESLSVSDDSQKTTGLIGLIGDDGGRTANIFGKNFKLTNSKFGAIVIDEGTSVDGVGINITPVGNLEISKNEFLQSFVVASKQPIIIAGGANKETNISGNTISKAIKTDKKVTIGLSNSNKTVFSGNIAKNGVNIGNYFISADGGIKVLGKNIEIKDNIVNDDSANPYGLFDASGGDIEIGSNTETETITISGNKAKQNFGASFMRTSNGNMIRFLSKNSINFSMQDSKDSFDKVLEIQGGGRDIGFISKEINIVGNYNNKTDIAGPSKSNLTVFFKATSLILGDAFTTELISINNIVLKEKNKYFFKFSESIEINTKGTGRVKLYNLYSEDIDNIDGAIFQADGRGYIKVKTGNLWYDENKSFRYKSDVKNAYLFKQDGDNQTDDEISIDNIQFISSDTKIAGFYYSKAKAFKLHGYTDKNTPVNGTFKNIHLTGMALIKIGNEEANADTNQYEPDPFEMHLGDFKFNFGSIDDKNTVAGIVLTNPKYIETDGSGKAKDTSKKGNLTIKIADGKTVDLTMPNNKPSIAVIANKQDYGADGFDRKVFEFGTTTIEGTGGAAKRSKIIMSGYNSLQTKVDNNFTKGFGKIKSSADNTVGKSSLVIGDNISEFDTGSSETKYILHEFNMKSGKIIVKLDNLNKDRNLFEWAGDYKTLSNGATGKGKDHMGGTITFEKGVTMDIDGDVLLGKFTIIPAGFDIKIGSDTDADIQSFFKHDKDTLLETREILYYDKANGLVISIAPKTSQGLVDGLKSDIKLEDNYARIIASSIENYTDKELNSKSSGNSNFDDFSRKIYRLLKYSLTEEKDKTNLDNRIKQIVDNVQVPDRDANNSSVVGTVGLSSLKTVTSIINDRIVDNTIPTTSVNSNLILLADNSDTGSSTLAKNSKQQPIDIFVKMNFGFGNLKSSDSNRKISNYGFLIGGDFGLLNNNKLTLGTSFMFDQNDLEGRYRVSNIKSIVFSLYSKYDILELKNKDKLYVYGITSYAHFWENEKAKIRNLNNKSNKSANIISIDAITGYRFNNIGLTPELGLGFIFGNQGEYTDNLGQNISSKNSVVISMKTNLRYDLPQDDMILGFKIGMSYDILSSVTEGFDVKNPVNLKYHINDSDTMDRFAFNYGLSFTYNINIDSNISLSYDGTLTSNLFNNRFSIEYRYKLR